jgi:hypothetical protein
MRVAGHDDFIESSLPAHIREAGVEGKSGGLGARSRRNAAGSHPLVLRGAFLREQASALAGKQA